MNLAHVETIAKAVLYEGYLLYPYRPSAVKNQKRWNFGVVYPPAYAEPQSGPDACSMHTECLLAGDPSAVLEVRVRFLHLQNRSVVALVKPAGEGWNGLVPERQAVERLKVGDRIYSSMQEAVECEIAVEPCRIDALAAQAMTTDFSFSGGDDFEWIRDEAGVTAAGIERRREPLRGTVDVAAEAVADGLFKISVHIVNREPMDAVDPEQALLRSFVSTHTILGVEGGVFVSLLDPPEPLRELAADCRNQGTWPVLAGEPGIRDTMLSSPIILYDDPQIAPESAGDLFDGTEIDEVLSLRILTMTDAEKQEMRQSDERARRLLERTESLPPEHLMKLHGAVRGLRLAEEESKA